MALMNREAGQLQNSNGEPLAYAVSQSMAFLTLHRATFAALAKEYLAPNQTSDGIMIAVYHPAQETMRLLLCLLNQGTALESKQ
jgi:hypothetical protein